MAQEETSSPNPEFRIGAPNPGSSLGELMAYHAWKGDLLAFLEDIHFWAERGLPMPGRGNDGGR